MTVVVQCQLSERDEAILRDLASVRLLSGSQLERLHFFDLATPASRSSSRRRTMQRLTYASLTTALPRRVGGERAGSAGLVYTLDADGQRWIARTLMLEEGVTRIRRPWSIGWPFVAHTLDVAELYVRLRERDRTDSLRLLAFNAEPASWHRTVGGLLKPDAYARWAADGWEQHLWIEVDRATESLPTLRRKLLGYLDAAVSGDLGPHGVLPRVLITTPSGKRADAIRGLIAALPVPAADLITVTLHADAFSAGRPPP